MNQKLAVLLGNVVLLHLAGASLVFTGGCAHEDPPMPPGIYVPKHGNTQPAQPQNVQDPAQGSNAGAVASPESTLEPQPATPSAVVEPAPTPAPAPAPAPAPKKQETTGKETVYKVVKGDSLWRLSRKFGIKLEDLAVCNGLAANAKLYIDQTLVIPAAGQKISGVSPKAKKYTAPKRSGKKKAVRKAAAGKKTAAAAKKKTIKKASQPLPPNGIYVVRSGDNFTVIARRFGLKISDIQKANPNVNSSRLQIGQKLKLTASASAVDAADQNVADNKSQDSTAADATPAAEQKNTPANVTRTSESDDMKKLLNSAKENGEDSASGDSAGAAKSNADTDFMEGKDKNQYVKLPDGRGAIRMKEDMTIVKFCKTYNITEDSLTRLNPDLPLDGVIKNGSLIKLP